MGASANGDSMESATESGEESGGFSTEVGDGRLRRRSSLSSSGSSGFSTDVSETRKRRRPGVATRLEGRDCQGPDH